MGVGRLRRVRPRGPRCRGPVQCRTGGPGCASEGLGNREPWRQIQDGNSDAGKDMARSGRRWQRVAPETDCREAFAASTTSHRDGAVMKLTSTGAGRTRRRFRCSVGISGPEVPHEYSRRPTSGGARPEREPLQAEPPGTRSMGRPVGRLVGQRLTARRDFGTEARLEHDRLANSACSSTKLELRLYRELHEPWHGPLELFWLPLAPSLVIAGGATPEAGRHSSGAD